MVHKIGMFLGALLVLPALPLMVLMVFMSEDHEAPNPIMLVAAGIGGYGAIITYVMMITLV